MEQFKKITIEDKAILTEYLSLRKYRACDFSIGNLILWSDVYNTQFAVSEDNLFIKFVENNIEYFTFPAGKGDLKQAFEWMFDYCREHDLEFKMNVVEPSMFEEIEKLYPGMFEISYQRNNADYVYNVEDLKNLSGKKYHGKKNHVNKFKKTHTDWSYEKITDENTTECIEMVKEWRVQNGCRQDKSKADEICALIKGLKLRKELNMIGGIIRDEGKIIALTLGEQSGDDMFIIHFEKAFSHIEGAYQMINQQFIINELAENFVYVNREEDMGVEGLRKAKESYHPAFMAEKGIVVKK